MNEKFYIEVSCQQKNHGDERVCGDVFLSKRIREEGRYIVVLSDGVGHGIKANMLAILTSTMALNFTEERKEITELADIIMNTLPVDSVKKLSYSTFTIIEIDVDGDVKILEYDNPKTVILRGAKQFDAKWNVIILDTEKNMGKEILMTSFRPKKEDRIVFCTDGVIQSGLGNDRLPMGWGQEGFEDFILESVKEEPGIAASRLAARVINKANLNDQFLPRDDMSCGVIYFRDPRKLMICTGPPQEEANDTVFAGLLKDFEGKKIISGATTADIIAREWHKTVTDSTEIHDPELPPASSMEGVELITEGILTLSKVVELLKNYNQNTKLGKGPAEEIVKMLLESDEIHFLAGTKINVAHQDPSLPVDLILRRTLVFRIVRVLEEKFMKETSTVFY